MKQSWNVCVAYLHLKFQYPIFPEMYKVLATQTWVKVQVLYQ